MINRANCNKYTLNLASTHKTSPKSGGGPSIIHHGHAYIQQYLRTKPAQEPKSCKTQIVNMLYITPYFNQCSVSHVGKSSRFCLEPQNLSYPATPTGASRTPTTPPSPHKKNAFLYVRCGQIYPYLAVTANTPACLACVIVLTQRHHAPPRLRRFSIVIRSDSLGL